MQQDQNTRNNEISQCFEKIIVDHRGLLKYNAVRGLTTDQEIVTYELDKESEFFHVLERDDDCEEYDELMNVINMFGDARRNRMWHSALNEMYEHWANYLND